MNSISEWIAAARKGSIDQRDYAAAGAGDIQLLPADRNRIAAIIFPPSAGALSVNFGRVSPANVGGRITSTMPPILLTIMHFGALVQGEIRGYLSGAGSVTVVGVNAGSD